MYNLAMNSFYDENRFYRVVPRWVVQFAVSGDPNITRKVEDAYLPNDPWNPAAGYSNLAGTMSFSSAYDSRGMAVNRTTELFINLANNSRLDRYVL